MKLQVLAVFDSAVQAYSRPFFSPTTGAAVRSFSDEVNRNAEDNPMNRHASDYELFELASFDEETGIFTQEIPRCVSRAKDCLK